ncbi:MAG: hypothetical protein RIS29_2624 [Bacteroidota bacterium]|jgi:hypothetical protein
MEKMYKKMFYETRQCLTSYAHNRKYSLKVSLLLFFQAISLLAFAGEGDKVTVSGGTSSAAAANGDYYYAGTTTVNGVTRPYYDMPSSIYRLEYRTNTYGSEWNVWESTARGGGGTIRFYNTNTSATVPLSGWLVDVGGGGAPSVKFTSGSVAPTVTTQAVSSISTTTATGNGTITALGSTNPTAYGVCWNTSTGPTTSNSKVDNGAASATGAFTASMTGLTPGTTYYVRAFATNTIGTSYGAEVSFTTTALAPTVTAVSPTTGLTTGGTSVTITGTNLAGATAVKFGTTAATGFTVNSATSITATAPAGSAGTVDITVTTVGGTSATSSADQFTYVAAPTATTGPATSIADKTATLNGIVNANNASTIVKFEYGLTSSYGSIIIADQSPLSGSSATSVSKQITGLTQNTTYHFRVIAISTLATTNGADQTFTTSISTGLSNTSTKEISIYPNPATDKVYIDMDNITTTVYLYNINGVIVSSKLIQGKGCINTTGLPKGFYLVKADETVKRLIIK